MKMSVVELFLPPNRDPLLRADLELGEDELFLT